MTMRRAVCAYLMAPLVIFAGCTVELPPGGNDNGNDDPPAQTIRVVVVNNTDTNLDPEIYRTGTPVGVVDFFNNANHKFTGFGVFTLGILGPRSSAQFDLPCSEARLLGTRGGVFGEDRNNPEGTGDQIVLTQDLSVFCNGQLTFTFSRNGADFVTNHQVER